MMGGVAQVMPVIMRPHRPAAAAAAASGAAVVASPAAEAGE
jgi:hypothetical protein